MEPSKTSPRANVGDRTGGCVCQTPRPVEQSDLDSVSSAERAAATDEGVEILDGSADEEIVVAEEDDGARILTDGSGVETAEPDDTLRLTDDGIEMPEFLKGYLGSFKLRTADITGDYQTTDSGMPDTEFYDGPIAVYPDDDGDYNPDLGPGPMAIGTPEHGEEIFEVVDERTEEVDSA